MKATIVPDIRSPEGGVAGAVEIRRYPDGGEVGGFACRCPCGCGKEMWLPVRAPHVAPSDRATWDWDGNETEPTLSPSVYNTGLPCQWHGYLRNGSWVLA